MTDEINEIRKNERIKSLATELGDLLTEGVHGSKVMTGRWQLFKKSLTARLDEILVERSPKNVEPTDDPR